MGDEVDVDNLAGYLKAIKVFSFIQAFMFSFIIIF